MNLINARGVIFRDIIAKMKSKNVALLLPDGGGREWTSAAKPNMANKTGLELVRKYDPEFWVEAEKAKLAVRALESQLNKAKTDLRNEIDKAFLASPELTYEEVKELAK